MVQEVHFDNKLMKYFKFGSGSKIMVMIPGLSVKSVMEYEESIKNDYKIFSIDYCVYCFDRINNPNNDYSIKDMAVDTLKAIELLGLKDIYLFGASQGAMIGFNMILLKEELFKKFCVASSCIKVDDYINNRIKDFIDYAKKGNKQDLYLGFSKLIYPNEIYLKFENVLNGIIPTINDKDLENFIIFSKSIINFDVFDNLKDINIPILFIHDKKDQLINIDNIYKMLDKYKDKNNISSYYFEGYGHALYDLAPTFKKIMFDYFMGE